MKCESPASSRALVARPRPDPELHGRDLGRVVGLEHRREAVREADPLRAGTDGTAFGLWAHGATPRLRRNPSGVRPRRPQTRPAVP